jgi:hypothetical protein
VPSEFATKMSFSSAFQQPFSKAILVPSGDQSGK